MQLHDDMQPVLGFGFDLMWRLIAGASADYGESWADHGRYPFRDGFARLYILDSGVVEIEADRVTHRLVPGELWLIPAGCTARYRCVEPMRLNWLHVNALVLQGVDLLAAGTVRHRAVGGEESHSFKCVLSAMLDGGPCAMAAATAIVARLAAPFLPGDWQSAGLDSAALVRLRPVLEYIAGNLAEECSVPVLAERVALHPVYFSRLFTQAVGISPGVYVTQARMRCATAQLATTCKPVKQIAAQCGYPDPYHFSRAFKRHIGVSPRGYRQVHAGLVLSGPPCCP